MFEVAKNIAFITALTLVIDGLYIHATSGPFVKMIERIQGSAVQIRWSGAIASYIVIVALIYKFIIVPRASLIDAFILGALAYGLYDAVNFGLLKNWNLWIALQDALWGGVLFMLVTKMYRMIIYTSEDLKPHPFRGAHFKSLLISDS